VRFITYDDAGNDRVGVLRDDVVHPLAPGLSVLDLLRSRQLRDAGAEALRSSRGRRPLAEVALRAPIPMPPTVRDFMTFERHVEGALKMAGPEVTVPDVWYQAPGFYFTNPYAICGPGDPVAVPPGCRQLDLELEVAAVIGASGHDVTPEEGEQLVAGYTILIDWSARDIQFAEMNLRLGPAKGKDSATTLGPVLVTADELEPRRSGTSYDLRMTAAVNGRPIGEDTLASMGYSFGDMVAYASRGTWVRPGDVLGSGTCGGGCLAELWGRQGLDAHPPLQPGDVVSVSVEELGSLEIPVVPGPDLVPVPPARTASRDR
jgi:2-keto-4-pentenoate hydratase/2-oxohepta-3-ene-1,7-dioic acid hydratase in catechol pathway